MDLKNATIIFSPHVYPDKRVKIFERLWDGDLDNGQLVDISFTQPYSPSVAEDRSRRPGDYTSIYFQLAPLLWDWPNAKDIIEIFTIVHAHQLNHITDLELNYQVAKVASTKWTVSLWNAEEISRAFLQLYTYMKAQRLELKRIDVKPQNAWDAGTIDQESRAILANTFRLACLQIDK